MANSKAKVAWLLSLFLLIGAEMAMAGSQPGSRVNGATASDSSVFPAASSATPVVTAMNPFDDEGVVYGVWLSTPASGAPIPYLTLRDSDTANTTSDVLLQVFFATATYVANTSAPGYFVKFDPPLKINNGLSINGSTGACPTQGPGTWCYTVVFDQLPF